MFGKGGPSFFELIHQALVSTRQGYDMLAPKFDATPFRTPDDILEPSIALIGSVDSALDLCCGTGAVMRLLRPVCRRKLTGIDFSPGMLRQAQVNMASAPGSASVEFIEADVLEMSFRNEFEVATCFGALGHILPKDQRAFLQGIRQALRPGGRFVFVTAPHPPLWSRTNLILQSFDVIMTIRNSILKPPFIMYYLNFLLPEIETVLKQEGFSTQIRPGLFPAPFHRNALVIATRLDKALVADEITSRQNEK